MILVEVLSIKCCEEKCYVRKHSKTDREFYLYVTFWCCQVDVLMRITCIGEEISCSGDRRDV